MSFAGVMCNGGEGSWTSSNEVERDAIVAASNLTDKELVFREDYIGTGPKSAWIEFPDGKVLATPSSVFDFACTQSPGSSLSDAVRALFAGGSPAPDCTTYLSAEAEERDQWLSLTLRHTGTSVAADNVANICEKFGDMSVADVVVSATSLLEEIRLAAFTWSGGPISITTDEGYSSDVVFSAELTDVSHDVANAPPGFINISFTVSMSATWTNTTSGRNNSQLVGSGLSISPVWPESSDVCRVLFSHAYGWANIGPDFQSNTGPFCLPQGGVSPGNPTLGPGESTSNSNSFTWTQPIPEAEYEAIRQALARDGAPFWIVYLDNFDTGHIAEIKPSSHDGCKVWNGAAGFKILGISTNEELPECPLNIS